MSKRKSKNETRPLSRTAFVAWWAVIYTAFCVVLWGLLAASPSTALNWPMCTVGTIVMTTMLSSFQVQLGQWFFKRSLQGWIDSSSIGSLLSIVLLAVVSPITPANAILILTLPTAFVQTVWLGRRSQWTGLWTLANLLLLLPASQYLQWYESGLFILLIPLIGLAQGLLQGLAISHLWAALPRPGKRKRFLVSEQADEEAAIQRLSLQDTPETLLDDDPQILRQSSSL